MQFAQIRDRVTIESGNDNAIDLSELIGTWVNSNPDTNGVARMTVSQSDGKLLLRVYAVSPDGLLDWGLADLTLFSASPSSKGAAGFTCLYDFGFVETQLQAMILKGLIVLAQIHRFKDDSRRVDYFVREYFALEHSKY
jgi:hypothetical protein